MRVKPIPKRLLPHTVEYKRLKGKDRYGDKNYDEPVTIRNVRLVGESAKVLSALSDEDKYTHVLFFDCANSSPYPLEFKNDSMIVKSGVEYHVKKVKPFETLDGRLHHFELELTT